MSTHQPIITVLLNEAARKSLAEKIKLVVASPAQRMQLVTVPDEDVYWRLEIRVEAQTEAGVKLLKDQLGNGVLFQGVVAGLGDGSAKNETVSGLGEGELDLDHGSGSEPQEPAAGN